MGPRQLKHADVVPSYGPAERGPLSVLRRIPCH